MTTTKARANGVIPKPAPDVEVGVSAFLPFVMPYRNAWEALRDEEVTVKQLAAMRKTDGQARALYRLITLPIRAALKAATFVPETGVEGGQDEATFIEQMFTLPASGGGMTVPFNRVIAQMLMAVFDGFSAFEMVYAVPKTGPLKGKLTLKKLAARPAETLTFLLDDHGDYAGLRQKVMFQGRYVDVTIPGEHSFYFSCNEEEKCFYGQSYFQSAFFHWDKKFKLYVIAHIAAQRAAVGTRVGKLPKNPGREEKAQFQRALADLGVAQWITVPEDYGVESLREATGFDFLALINHHNSQMSKSILAAFFDKEQGGGDSGKLVDFGTQSDALFLLLLQTIMGEIEEVINQKVIPRFIDWNFGSGLYPKFQFGSMSAEQKTALLDMFKTLSVAGQALTIRPEFVHELEKQVAEEFGLEIDWETVEQEMVTEKETAAANAAAGGLPGLPGDVSGVPATESPVIDPSLVPEGYTLLTDSDDEVVALAYQALDEAYDALLLTRGKPNSGGPKFVRTPAGARIYGVPVGTPITRDIAQRTAAHGVKGKPFGGGIRDPQGSKTGHEVLGGGPGSPAQNLGGVVTKPNSENVPRRIFTNPKAPGAQLLQFRDGTVVIVDSHGRMSPRQQFDLHAFISLGWQVDATAKLAPGVTVPGSPKAPAAQSVATPAGKATGRATASTVKAPKAVLPQV